MRYLYLSILVVMSVSCLKAETSKSDLDEIKQELITLKKIYEQKIQQLELRLQEVEKSAKKAQIAAKRTETNLRRTQEVSKSENSFNPAFSVIFDGKYVHYDRDPEDFDIPGFQLGGESAPVPEGFNVAHSEFVASANIDDLFFGKITYALISDNLETEVELEEAFVETIGLGAGLSIKTGRFFSDAGYLNAKHSHVWDFIDMPLVYRAMLGGNYADDGIQVSWLAPTSVYSHFGIELYKGDTFPSGGAANHKFATWTAFMAFGGDWGVEHSWQTGLSFWNNNSEDRQGGGHHHGDSELFEEVASFSGDSDLVLFDFVYKWAPDGNAKEQNLKLQFEYFDRQESGLLSMIGSDPFEITSYNGKQKGYYLQGIYQFMPKWRIGMRYDYLDADNNAFDTDILEEAGLVPFADNMDSWSLMLDYSNSEFSRFRIQFSKEALSNLSDNKLYLQYILSMGSHGAHSF